MKKFVSGDETRVRGVYLAIHNCSTKKINGNFGVFGLEWPMAEFHNVKLENQNIRSRGHGHYID